jgi:hypothetical protein
VPAATYPVVAAIAILGPYGVVYLGTAAALRVPELANIRRVGLRLE